MIRAAAARTGPWAATIDKVDVTWFAPLAVLVVGAFVAALLTGRLLLAADDLRASLRRFRRIEHGLIPIRVETRRAQAAIARRSSR